MRAEEITDEESFEAWLDARPEKTRREEALALATRAALRAFLKWFTLLDVPTVSSGIADGLPIVRALVLCQVSLNKPSKLVLELVGAISEDASDLGAYAFDIKEIEASWSANAAAEALNVAVYDLKDAIESISSAFEAVGRFDTFWPAFREDASRLERGLSVLDCPLWNDESPPDLQAIWKQAREWLLTDPGHNFWISWYEAILAGRPLTDDWDSHWQLLHDIALIPDEDWKKGAEHVAGRIAEIERIYPGVIDHSSSRSAAFTSADPAPPNVSTSASKVIDAISRDEIKATLARNKRVLPANLGAISSLTELELVRIERLRGDNSLPENLRDELKFHSEMLQTLLVAFDQMKERVEGFGDAPSDEDAEAAKSLIKHFIEMGQKWPRENAEELVDSAYRNVLGAAGNGFRACGMFGLYSLMTLFLPIAPGIAAPIAGAIFGAEKVASTLVKHLRKKD